MFELDNDSTQPERIKKYDDGDINLIYPRDKTKIYLPHSLLATGQYEGKNVFVNGIRCDSDPYDRIRILGMTIDDLRGATWDKVRPFFELGKHKEYFNADRLNQNHIYSDVMFKGMSFEETIKYFPFTRGGGSYGNEWFAAVSALSTEPNLRNFTTAHTPLGYKELFSAFGQEKLYNDNLDLLESMEEVSQLNPDKRFFITGEYIKIDGDDKNLNGDFDYYPKEGVGRC